MSKIYFLAFQVLALFDPCSRSVSTRFVRVEAETRLISNSDNVWLKTVHCCLIRLDITQLTNIIHADLILQIAYLFLIKFVYRRKMTKTTCAYKIKF